MWRHSPLEVFVAYDCILCTLQVLNSFFFSSNLDQSREDSRFIHLCKVKKDTVEEVHDFSCYFKKVKKTPRLLKLAFSTCQGFFIYLVTKLVVNTEKSMGKLMKGQFDQAFLFNLGRSSKQHRRNTVETAECHFRRNSGFELQRVTKNL